MSFINPIDLTYDEDTIPDTSAVCSNNEDDEIIDLHPISKGMVVKVDGKEVFGEWNCERNNITDVFGITDFVEDTCNITGKVAWHIKYHIGRH